MMIIYSIKVETVTDSYEVFNDITKNNQIIIGNDNNFMNSEG